MKYPISCPIAVAEAHKLCMSAAREGCLILFSATQASMVTSDIATPALAAVNDNTANARCSFSCTDIISREMMPIQPELTPMEFSSEKLHQSFPCKFTGNIKDKSVD